MRSIHGVRQLLSWAHLTLTSQLEKNVQYYIDIRHFDGLTII